MPQKRSDFHGRVIPPTMTESFNDWGVGDVTNLSPFREGTERKQSLRGTYLTNPLVKLVEFGASLPTMQGIM